MLILARLQKTESKFRLNIMSRLDLTNQIQVNVHEMMVRMSLEYSED